MPPETEIETPESPTETMTSESPQTEETGSTKTESGQAEEPKKESLLNEGAKPTPSVAPEKYEDFRVPEGFTLDKAVFDDASKMFKEMNLPQAEAQKLVDFYVKQTQATAEAPFKLWEKTQEDWRTAVKADPEIGGKLAEVRTTVSRAIDGLGDPALAKAFREAMDVTGVGNHPAFVKAFYKLASKLTEGSHVSGAGPSPAGQQRPGAARDAAHALYPNLS